jgi:uncharacterized membrane protein
MQVHEKSVVVNAPVDDVFSMWRNWEDFPKFMSSVKNVKQLSPDLTHWEGRIAGIDEEWDAKTTDCVEDKLIGWESVAGFKNKGHVKFDDLDGRTNVTVHFEYDPPAGAVGVVVDKAVLGRQFDQTLEDDLNRFKSHAETEEGD